MNCSYIQDCNIDIIQKLHISYLSVVASKSISNTICDYEQAERINNIAGMDDARIKVQRHFRKINLNSSWIIWPIVANQHHSVAFVNLSLQTIYPLNSLLSISHDNEIVKVKR